MFMFYNYQDGDVLFPVNDGILAENGLLAKIIIHGEKGQHITVNGIDAVENPDGVYTAEILLSERENKVFATNINTKECQRIFLYYFADAYKKYYFGVDDVIRCFQNIANHNEYTSIFDDPFIRIFKDAHDKYGTVVHFHIYYETVDKTFNLSMFPDRFKEEFENNADWLRLGFHARADLPDSPYKNATFEQVYNDGVMVNNEILRFAGEKVLDGVTSMHWGDAKRDGTRAFRELGYKVLDGYFEFDKYGEPAVSYYFSNLQTVHLSKRDFWIDREEDIIFVKTDIVVNTVKLDKIDEFIDKITASECNAFHYLLIHEQYFYADYVRYEPDYRERIFKAIERCHTSGYRPAAISQIAFQG